MPTRRTWKTACFSYEVIEELKDLGDAFCRLDHGGDTRVIGFLDRAFSLLEACMNDADTAERREQIFEEFSDAVGHDLGHLEDCMLDACVSLGAYGVGLEMCDRFAKIGERTTDDILHDRAEFLARLGRSEEAERLLVRELVERPDDVWLYIALGDITFTYEPQREHRDLLRAESWYYRAYDRGLIGDGKGGGRVLGERLRDACIDRMRYEREGRLLITLERLGVGGRKTIADLTQDVWSGGSKSALLYHLRSEIERHATRRNESPIEAIRTLTAAIEFVPQERFDGYSSFEMLEFFPTGEHEARIRREASYVFRHDAGSFAPNNQRAIARQATIEADFFADRDPLTGKSRLQLIADERKKTRKLFEEGKLQWKGFVKFRQKTPDLFADFDIQEPQAEKKHRSHAGQRQGKRGARRATPPKAKK